MVFFLVIRLLAEGAAFNEDSLTSGRAAEDGGTVLAVDDGGRVAEDVSDGEARGALDIHEEGVRALNETTALVALTFSASSRVAQIAIVKSHSQVCIRYIVLM